MFPRRRWMRRWGNGGFGGPWGYGMPFGWRRRYYRPGFGCCPGCCLAFVLPGLLLMGLAIAAFVHFI